jgi:hypothetical protein
MSAVDEPTSLPPQLAIAEEWARNLGNRVTRAWGTYPDGRREPAIFIGHGVYTIICTEQSGALSLVAIVEIQDESREKLRRLAKADQDKILAALKVTLMQEGRSGFSFFPAEFQLLWEIQKYQLTQAVRVARDDASTFNRFADSIQEISSGLLRSTMVLASLPLRQVSGGSPSMLPDSGSTSMYR